MKRLFGFFFLLATVFVFFSCNTSKNPVIAFYGVDENTRNCFSDSLKRWYGDAPYDILVLDDSIPLKDALKKTKNVVVLISWYGSNAESVSEKLITPPAQMYNRYPTTVRNLSSVWMPVAADHAEIAYRNRNLPKNDGSLPRTLEDAVAYVRNNTGKANTARWPMVLPGQNDAALSLFITSLVESTWDDETAENLNHLIAETEQKALKANAKAKSADEMISVFETVHHTALNEKGATLQDALSIINSWREEDLLHPDWLTRKNNYVEILMEDGQAEIVFMPLSVHRTMNFRIVKNFTDSFMPVNRTAGASFNRSLVLPALCVSGIHQKQKGADEETLKLLEFLTSNDEVSVISIVSGLAPLTSSAETADTQASDVRFYAAASDRLLQDMGSAFVSKAERTAFFEELRASFE